METDDTEHLTPEGKKKPQEVDREAQLERHAERIQDEANKVLPPSTIKRKPTERKPYWWEKD